MMALSSNPTHTLEFKSRVWVAKHTLFFYYYKFLLGYIHYTGGIRSDNSNQTFTLFTLPPSSLKTYTLEVTSFFFFFCNGDIKHFQVF
jgi:hypothetical protein